MSFLILSALCLVSTNPEDLKASQPRRSDDSRWNEFRLRASPLNQNYDEWKRELKMDLQFDVFRHDPWWLNFEMNHSLPFDKDFDNVTYWISNHSLRLGFVASPLFQPLIRFRQDSVRGDEISGFDHALGTGLGFRSEGNCGEKTQWKSQFELGEMRWDAERKSPESYFFAEWEGEIKTRLFGSARSALQGAFEIEAKSMDSRWMAAFSPRLSYVSEAGTDLGVYAEWTRNEEHPVFASPEKDFLTWGLDFRRSLTASSEAQSSWHPRLKVEAEAGGNADLFVNSLGSELQVSMLRWGDFRNLFVLGSSASRYLRNGDKLSTSLYTLDTGFRLIWAGFEEDSPDPWGLSLDLRFFHRSEHLSNPPTEGNTDGPETLSAELSSPGTFSRDDRPSAWKIFRVFQGSVRIQKFVFVDRDRVERYPEQVYITRRADEDFIVRSNLRVWPLRLWEFSGLVDPYVFGQRSFFGEDVEKWALEMGAVVERVELFARLEHRRIGHQPEYENDTEAFAGLRLRFDP